jgi:hypothetical protein
MLPWRYNDNASTEPLVQTSNPIVSAIDRFVQVEIAGQSSWMAIDEHRESSVTLIDVDDSELMRLPALVCIFDGNGLAVRTWQYCEDMVRIEYHGIFACDHRRRRSLERL